MKSHKLLDSFNYAFQGIIYALKTQRNMKIHFVIAVIVLFFSSICDISKTELLFLFFTIALVIVTEMINTAIEAAIDLVTKEYRYLAKVAKNVAAGAVLISTFNAVIVAYIIFFDKISNIPSFIFNKIKYSPIDIIFISLIVVTIVVITLKVYFKKGTPFRGGMPSGHSAVAFCILVAIAFLSNNIIIVILAFFLYLLIVQSRIEGGFHTIIEVIIGSLVGGLITLLIFKLLS